MSNVLKAILNFEKYRKMEIVNYYKSSIKIQAVGDALEYYIKDLFCGTIKLSKPEKEKKYSDYFSYLGNSNNPPDFILKNNDAVEVKKIESSKSSISLNSSSPKDRLRASDPLITENCRSCEEKWEEKDILYAIGQLKDNSLDSLWLLYGQCFAAHFSIYQKIKDTISNGITQISNIEFSQTKELGRVNKVDPLGITYLRIRGMWGIEHPIKIFDYIENTNNNILNCILLSEKYKNMPQIDQRDIENSKMIHIENISIKDPNNPAKWLDAKHIYITRNSYV